MNTKALHPISQLHSIHTIVGTGASAPDLI